MQRKNGFTIIEIIIVITIIGILLSLVFTGVADSRAKARDKERTADIDLIHSSLEQYYSDNGGYPATIDETTLPQVNKTALKGPDGQLLVNKQASDQAAAFSGADPNESSSSYFYFSYPVGCTSGLCTGYILKSFIEEPNKSLSNPYARTGLHNN